MKAGCFRCSWPAYLVSERSARGSSDAFGARRFVRLPGVGDRPDGRPTAGAMAKGKLVEQSRYSHALAATIVHCFLLMC
jgi:hypothetical protein